MMEVTKSTSTNINDYEVLIRRRGENDYASYCPQLNFMIIGTEHEEVALRMKDAINEYIKNLK